jgi:hypothetical protein
MIKLTEWDVNQLFDIIRDKGEKKWYIITEDFVKESDAYNDYDYDDDYDTAEEDFKNIFSLIGYKIKYEKDGYHKTDGQMVEYTITLENKDGIKTHISTEMCLMYGWNFDGDVEIK